MKNVDIINNRIYDYKLIGKEQNNQLLNKVMKGNIELNELNDISLKKILICINPLKIKEIDFKKINSDNDIILKYRYKIIESNTNDIFKTLLIFYNYLEKNSLNEIIKYLLNLEDNIYNHFIKLGIIPKIIDDLKHEKYISNKDIAYDILKYDYKTFKYIDYKYIKKEEVLNFICDNNKEIDENIIENINLTRLENIDLIYKLILLTPRTYRYFDHILLTKDIIKNLINDFYENNNYKVFCSDPRFYKFLKRGTGIVSIINKFIPLRKAGKNYFGLCPFHDDHTPSLCVSEEKNIWKCFSCHIGGFGAESFIEKYNGNDYFFNKSSKKNKQTLYFKNKKNTFLYYLYSNLPSNLKKDEDLVKLFLERDGCLLKLLPKELKNREDLIDIAMKNDITSIRYFINNDKMVKKYLKIYPSLNYYFPKSS